MSPTWDELAVGACAPERVVGPIDRTDIVRYEGASVFFNPIHHDELFATGAGFPTPISVGMLQAGLWSMWAVDWLGARNVRRVRFSFKEQVFPGDVLVCTGSVVRRYVSNDEQLVDIEGNCARRGGGIAVAAQATFAVGR
jgi:acyl dehydratase